MHLTYRGVNDAFNGLVRGIHDGSIPTRHSPSRVGDVLQVEEPVIITYTHPLECVLFNKARDANPFFHIVESIWMLAGCNDIASLAYYAANYAAQVQDGDSPVANGAYGYRWRHAALHDVDGCQEADQLEHIISQLKHKPESRRCVLQMWDVENDLLKIDTSRDVCCNVCAFFSLDDGGFKYPYKLNMTVINRSNDLIWGMLGANACHFSMLLEYMAACIGVEVGTYNQITNNLHTYTSRWEPEKWLADDTPNYYTYVGLGHHPAALTQVPLVKDPATFDEECQRFITMGQEAPLHNWAEPFLQTVAAPMCWAFSRHKMRDYNSALNTMSLVAADDWRVAGRNWLLKRKALWEAKQGSVGSV